jgi:hypothetical protein
LNFPRKLSNISYHHRLLLYAGKIQSTAGNTISLSNVVIRKGTMASSSIPAELSGSNVSWKFNSAGLTMWNGVQNDSNKIFEVNKKGAYIEGEIVAKSGKIGNMTIEQVTEGIKQSPNKNYLHNSAFFSGFGWSGIGTSNGTNPDGTGYTRTLSFSSSDSDRYNGHESLRIVVKN